MNFFENLDQRERFRANDPDNPSFIRTLTLSGFRRVSPRGVEVAKCREVWQKVHVGTCRLRVYGRGNFFVIRGMFRKHFHDIFQAIRFIDQIDRL